jgi:hypothetical protein
VVFAVLALAELISTGVTRLVGFEVPIELWYTTLALLAAFMRVNRLNGGEELGNFLLHLFFAVLGADTVLSTLIGQGPVFFLFLVILVAIHALVVFGIGRWRKIEIETLCVASQATVGGPPRRWPLRSPRGLRPRDPIGALGCSRLRHGQLHRDRDNFPDPLVHRVAGRAEVSARVRRLNPPRPDLGPPT